MKLVINQLSAALQGQVHLPGDKSISHRALMHAALSPSVSVIDNLLLAGVTAAMERVLQQVGVQIERHGARVVMRGGALCSPAEVLDCGNSGTTIRLLLGLLAGQPGLRATLTGSPGLQKRPMARLVQPLNVMGANIVGDTAPLVVRGQPLVASEHHLSVASAQVKAALLMAGLQANGPITIHEPGPSRDHSERMLRALGVTVQSGHNTVTLIPPSGPLPGTQLTVPGDISSAAFLIVAALLVPGSAVRLIQVGVNPTRTGLIEVLQAMGGDIRLHNPTTVGGEPVADIEVRHSALQGIQVGGDVVVRMIDEFPIFAVAASQAIGSTVVRDARELRYKETDRIRVLVGELARLGVAIEEREDGFAITGPQQIQSGRVDSHFDHRLAMALAVAGMLAAGQTEIAQAEAIAESFPTFIDLLGQLGAELITQPD